METNKTIEKAIEKYAKESFIWPLNKQGEKQAIPPNQTVPNGYAKHLKTVKKHFTAGYRHKENEENNLCSEDYMLERLFGLDSDLLPKKWFEELKKEDIQQEQLDIQAIISSYENKESRPLKFSELCIILIRFKMMLEEEPNRYTIEEFIQQEDFRRDMFS